MNGRRKLKGRATWRGVFLALMFALLLGMPVGSAGAQDPPVTTIMVFRQNDHNRDGRPERAVIECRCVSERDWVAVFDGGGDMKASPAWDSGTDTINDTWVFDIKADRRVELIAVFRQESVDGQVWQYAEFYDDRDGDKNVAYDIAADGRVKVTEFHTWTVQIRAPNGWYLPNGDVNKNIEVLIDREEGELEKDGVPDTLYMMKDAENDGIIDYYVNLPQKVDAAHATGHSGMQYNAAQKITRRAETALFFPFLNFRPPRSEAGFRYLDILPSVVVEWSLAQIEAFRMPGYPIEHGFHLNSIAPISRTGLSAPDFEAPHAYYDLADNGNNLPELNIRVLVSYVDDAPNHEVRYSWNLFNIGSLGWDYKVGLLGYHPITSVVDYGDFELQMVSHEKLPYWVTEQKWDLSTFVAVEDPPKIGSEGLYDWTPREGPDPVSAENPSAATRAASTGYLAGSVETPPYQFFDTINPGLRAELNFKQTLEPRLYFSPLDRRLHMVKAEEGLGRLDEFEIVEYHNLNGDDYIDQWIHRIGSEQIASLTWVEDYLIFSDRTETIVMQTHIPDPVFFTQPPRNHQDWLMQHNQLQLNAPDFAFYDFKAMFEQFEGPRWTIRNGSLENVRLTDDGFRMVLALAGRYDWESEIAGVGEPDARAAEALWRLGETSRYVVTFADGEFEAMRAMTPPQFFVNDTSFRYFPNTIFAFNGVEITMTVQNIGLEDAENVRIELNAFQEGNTNLQAIAAPVLDIPGEGSVTVTRVWTPIASGDWRLGVQLGQYPELAGVADPTEEQLAAAQLQVIYSSGMDVKVALANPMAVSDLLSLSGEQPYNGLFVVALLISLAVAAAMLFLLIARSVMGITS